MGEEQSHKQETEDNQREADVRELREKVVSLEQKSEEYLKKLQYLQADFENYKKRVERELGKRIERERVNLFRKMLEILDNMERAIESSKKTRAKKPLEEGVQMLTEQFKAVLREEGCEEIDSVGKKFDPKFHEAVAFVESDVEEDNIILEENRKGYCLGDTLIRPSKVIVGRRCKDEQSDRN